MSAVSTFADFFCGIGGFHIAAANAGLKCVFACDNNRQASQEYTQNFGIQAFGDITELETNDIPDHDLFCAGFPCQPFSVIGNMKGLDDRRGTLIYEIVRVLEGKQPCCFILENVASLTTLDGGAVMDHMLQLLEETGYSIKWKILNALDFGVPQRRKRAIIAGFADPVSAEMFQFPSPLLPVSLSDVLEAAPGEEFYVSDDVKARRHAAHTTTVQPSVWHENIGGEIHSRPYSYALRASASSNYLLVDGERKFTPRELLRLQGFPETFKLSGSYNQIRKQTGNAVPVPMIESVIKNMVSAADHHLPADR